MITAIKKIIMRPALPNCLVISWNTNFKSKLNLYFIVHTFIHKNNAGWVLVVRIHVWMHDISYKDYV